MTTTTRSIAIAVAVAGLILAGVTAATGQGRPPTPPEGKAPLAAVDLQGMSMDVHLNLGATVKLDGETDVLDENGSRISVLGLHGLVTEPPSVVVSWEGRETEGGVVADRVRVVGPLD